MCGNESESVNAIEDTRARSRVTKCRRPPEISVEVFDISSAGRHSRVVPITWRVIPQLHLQTFKNRQLLARHRCARRERGARGEGTERPCSSTAISFVSALVFPRHPPPRSSRFSRGPHPLGQTRLERLSPPPPAARPRPDLPRVSLALHPTQAMRTRSSRRTAARARCTSTSPPRTWTRAARSAS